MTGTAARPRGTRRRYAPVPHNWRVSRDEGIAGSSPALGLLRKPCVAGLSAVRRRSGTATLGLLLGPEARSRRVRACRVGRPSGRRGAPQNRRPRRRRQTGGFRIRRADLEHGCTAMARKGRDPTVEARTHRCANGRSPRHARSAPVCGTSRGASASRAGPRPTAAPYRRGLGGEAVARAQERPPATAGHPKATPPDRPRRHG